MLPGTYAFVGTGYVGKAVLEGGGVLGVETWQVKTQTGTRLCPLNYIPLSSTLQLGLGIGATLLALGFVGQIAKQAIEDMDPDSKKPDESQDDNQI